jgi:hypothetical protein
MLRRPPSACVSGQCGETAGSATVSRRMPCTVHFILQTKNRRPREMPSHSVSSRAAGRDLRSAAAGECQARYKSAPPLCPANRSQDHLSAAPFHSGQIEWSPNLSLVAVLKRTASIPALMMTAEINRMQYCVAPLVDPTAPLYLVIIEPMRPTLIGAFLEILREEAVSLNNNWRPYFETETE